MSDTDAPSLVPLPEEVLGFGAFRLIRELGRGGMGTVYLAEVREEAFDATGDTSTEIGDVAHRPEPGTRVALKTFHPHLVDSTDFARRFRREARMGASIGHPNVVRTFEAGSAKLRGTPTSYMAMEYVEGQTLRDLIKELGHVPHPLAAVIAKQVASGLDAIHAAGVTHRDLKPENVIITSDHRVKLMDLGVAKLREASIRLSMTGQFLGSVHYASPEQFRNPDSVDARTDLYALGVLLFEMLSGRNPFFHNDIRVVLRRTVSEMPRRLSLDVPGTPPVLDQLAWTLVQKDPVDRLQTAAEVLDVLERGEESAWWHRSGRERWTESGERLLHRMAVARETRVVGRETELRELRRLFDLAASGSGQTVLVEGEAGVGKTRLLDEFAASLAEENVPFHFLFGAAAQSGTGRPMHSFAEALLAALDPEDVQGSLAKLLPEAAPVAAFADFLRGVPGSATLSQDQLRTLFAASFGKLSADKPLLLVLDDVHLASETSLQLLAYLARDERASRMLVAAAFRPPEEGAPLHQILHGARDASMHHMPLARLTAKDVGSLLREVLRSEHLVQEFGFRLMEKTDGNPFFILEVLHTLQHDRVLTKREDGVWSLAGSKVEIVVPDSVKELLQGNLGRLTDEDRDLVDVAAVIGQEFDPDLLAEVLAIAKIPLLRRLSHLERKHRLIRSVGKLCRFDRPQLRETLYAGLMEGLRDEYHAQVGECLERRRGGGRPPEEVDGASCFEIAWHLVLGGRADRAEKWMARALRQAAQTYRIDDGIVLASRFLDAADVADAASVPPETRVDVLIALVGFHEHEGRRDEERRRLDRAAAVTTAVGDTRLSRRVRDLRLAFHFQVGDHEAAAEACRESLAEALAVGHRDLALAALGNLACAERSLGRFDEAAAHIERAMNEFLAPESAVRRCLLLGSLGLVEIRRGKPRAAQRLFLEAKAVAARFGLPEPAPFTASAPGDDGTRDRFLGLARALGRHAESRIDGERTLLLETGLPRRLQEAAAMLSLSVLGGLLSMTTDERACLLGALEASRNAGDRRFEAAVLHALGENALAARDLALARREFAQALEIRRAIGYRPGVCESLLALGQLASIAGDSQAARTCLDEATDLASSLQMPANAALARATAAMLHAKEGRPDLARAELAHAQAALAGTGPYTIGSRAEGLWFAALVAKALGDDAAHAAHVAAAWRTLRAIADRLPEGQRKAFLTGTSPNREITAAAGGDTG